jgi:hypothetical protein
MTNYKEYGKKLSDNDKKILNDKLKELEIEGYGKYNNIKKNKKKK